MHTLIEQLILANKEKIKLELPEVLVGSCGTFDLDTVIAHATVNVLSDLKSKTFREDVELLEETAIRLELFSEEEVWDQFESSDVSLCNECGWWDYDVVYESAETNESVCSECHENHLCGECGELPDSCECEE